MPSHTDSRYDVLKIVLAIMIVALHSTLFPSILLPWLRISVPIFFILSSYFFFSKIFTLDNNEEEKKALFHFLKRSTLLYIFWLIVLIVPTIEIRQYYKYDFPECLFTIIYDALFGQTFAASWFISANIIATLLIYLLRHQRIIAGIISLILYIICVLTSNYGKAFPELISFLNNCFPRFTFYFSFPAAMLWIWLGMILSRIDRSRMQNRICWLLLSIVGCVMLYFEHNIVNQEHWVRDSDVYFSLLILCPSLFMFVRSLPQYSLSHSLLLRQASVIIYCTHGTTARLLLETLRGAGLHGSSIGIITFLITLSVSLIITAILLLLKRKFTWLKIAC